MQIAAFLFPYNKTLMKYNTAIEIKHATCLPPEAYMRLWESIKNNCKPPTFMRSVYPQPKPTKNDKLP